MSPISQLKKENNDLISDDYEKACLLNNYFCSISTLNDSNTSKPDFPLRTNATLAYVPTLERLKAVGGTQKQGRKIVYFAAF